MNIINKRFYLFAFCLLALMLVEDPIYSKAQNILPRKVSLQRTPDNGIQPQAVVDSKGIVHLLYYKGDPMAGDIYYVRQNSDGKLLTPPYSR
jgi:hypothetical protein